MKEYLKGKGEIIDQAIEGFLGELNYPETISSGMRYGVLNGGKRLRPILLLMTLDLLNSKKDEKLGLATGVAIEFIHSYSLIHDDLPALDNDDYRRGKPSTHKKFGEAEAILIGDALLTHSFGLVAREKAHSDKIVKIIKLVSEYAGINGMIGGQMVDIESEEKKIDLGTLKYIHEYKTGKLLLLPIECGCILGEATEEEEKALKKYGQLIGLGFQIKDDLLDIDGTFEEIGKPVGSDLELEKSTYPSILGIEKTRERLKEVIEEAKEVIEEAFGERGEIYKKLADYIMERRK